MKNLILLFAISLTLFACQKPEQEDPADKVEIIGPQDVTYKMYTRTNAAKHVVCKLYAVNADDSKGQLVGVIDTVVTDSGWINFTLTQTQRPTFKCYAGMEVHVLNGEYDTFGLSIEGGNRGLMISRGGTCDTDFYNLEETLFSLYSRNL